MVLPTELRRERKRRELKDKPIEYISSEKIVRNKIERKQTKLQGSVG